MSPTNQRPQRHNERFPSTPWPSSSATVRRTFLRIKDRNALSIKSNRKHIKMCKNFRQDNK
ncbi:hypothetical protein T07_443 [Trichinella nelsoni]|uniref:Uncharacterized protein n=1 Tax=Trichinella nelsoni TaxID=6336 RepID=A0A0V0RUA4_9BILA|nr:hypothetical protein T07_443 [Trichinella nelsoni]